MSRHPSWRAPELITDSGKAGQRSSGHRGAAGTSGYGDLIDRVRRGLGERYAVESEIGQGGMAVVFLAEDRRHHRRVALKVLRPELLPVLGAERFLREIEIVAQLAHPNILPLYDSGEIPGTKEREPRLLYYVMPYVEGETLRQRLRREGRLSLEQALQIARQVAGALSFAHSRGLVHRDIKPENILFQAGQAMVSDFGLAREVSQAGGERLTESGMAVGTLSYMSPEQAAGVRDLDSRSDLYSLGVVLYEMLAGDVPLAPSASPDSGQGPSADLRRARRSVPGPVAAIVARTLARDPAGRFATTAQFIEALDHSLGPAAKGLAWGASRAWPRAAAWLAAVVVVVAGAWYAVRPHRSSADERRIVVAPFEDRTGDPAFGQLGDLAADWVTRGLSQSQSFDAVPSTLAREAWRDVPAGSPERMRAIAERTGAAVVVSGSYSRDGTSVRFEAELIDAGSGRLITSVEPVGGPADNPGVVVAALAGRVVAAAVARLDPDAQRTPSGGFNPPSLEAFREYQEGRDLFSRGQWEQAIAHLSRASAMDSGYVPPRAWLVPAYMNLGRWGAADTLVLALRPFYDRLTPTERATLEWYAAGIHGDRDGALRWTGELYRLDPRSGAYGFAFTLVNANLPRRALEVLSRYDRGTPFASNWMAYWRVYGTAYHLLGDYGSELDVARRWRKQRPEDLAGMTMELRAQAALGRLAEVDEGLARVASLRPGDEGAGRGSSHALTLLILAQELLAHGHADAAATTLERLIAQARSGTLDDADPYTVGRALYLDGRWAEARAVFDSLHRAQPGNVNYLGALGCVYARQGDHVRAAVVDSLLAALRNPYARGTPKRWRAQIAAVLGDRERAVQLLRQVNVTAIELHQEPDFAGLRDYAPFQELSKPKG